jgi:AraC-like DNA-binding protein
MTKEVLDLVGQRGRDTEAALKLLWRLLHNQPDEPQLMTTDGLASFGAALDVLDLRHLHRPCRLGENNRSIGDQVLSFDAGSYFIVPVDLPAIGQIEPAGIGRPYLAVSLALEPAIVAAMLAELENTTAPVTPDGPCHTVSGLTPDLINAWLRMMKLIDSPTGAALLAPMIEREILFRALQGPQGHVLRHIAREDGRVSRVRQAIDKIQASYDEPLRVECLATLAGMSLANFYRHFRAVTAMTPIQYQKRLRLLTARRRLLFEPRDAAAVAFSVGYESPSQFSREYARMFGLPPVRDMARFKPPPVVGGKTSPAEPPVHLMA